MAKKLPSSAYFIRFVLEVVAIIAIGWYGSTFGEGWMTVLFASIAVVCTLLIWGIFNVPGDPSRSGKAPVVVSGKVRLGLELMIFVLASYSFHIVLNDWLALTFLAIVIAHYFHIKERNQWLLKQ